MNKRRLHSRTTTRIAFGVIIVFVLAQVLWWIIFQARLINSNTEETLSHWQRDASTANSLLLLAPGNENLIRQLQESYPQLLFDNQQFVVDNRAVIELEQQQRGYIRMFAFEGPFFVLVVLFGLYIIALSLRTERELKRRQQNFLSAISHEFRTPIGTLRLLIETALYRSLSPEKQRDYLQRMDRELTRLETTSEQVLASARLEQTGTSPQLTATELNREVREIVQRSKPGLEARGVSLLVDYSPESLPVSLEPSAFNIVINNLLDNAVKYSPEDNKPIRLHLETRGHLVMLHVEDQGVGISESEAKNIFDKFYRVGSEMTRDSTGVGLGLYLVKSITEAMNGWVKYEALDKEQGRGSRFTVILPRRLEQGSKYSSQAVVSE